MLYFNSFEINSGWGEECFRSKSFNKLNIQTINIDYRKNRFGLCKILFKISDFDLCLIQKGDFFPLEIIKSINRPKILYYTDIISRFNSSDHLFKSKLFDMYLVRSQLCKKTLIEKGWVESDKIKIHLSGFDPTIYQKLKMKKDIDLLFVGTLTDRRKRIIEKIRKHFNIRIVKAFSHEACKYYNKAKIILNIHGDQFLDTEIRIFEVLGSGGFLITEKLGDENPFGINDLVQFNNFDDLIQKISFYLNSPKERETISDNGYKKVHKCHTYDHRAIELKKVFINLNSHFKSSAVDYKQIYKYSYIEPILKLKDYIRLRTRVKQYF